MGDEEGTGLQWTFRAWGDPEHHNRPRAPRECLNTGPSRWGAERGEGNHIVHTWPPTYRGKKRPIFIGRNKELSLAESKSLLLLDLRGSAR